MVASLPSRSALALGASAAVSALIAASCAGRRSNLLGGFQRLPSHFAMLSWALC